MKEREPRVFVVDDDQSVRTSLATLLETEDYAVEIFASADEYLARVPHPGPACLVLDVRLPGLDGLALQRQLTEAGRMEQIVFITGHGDIPMGIGAELGITIRTIKTHRARVMQKGATASWNNGSGSACGARGGSASWGGGSGSATGFRGGTASWGGGSGSYHGAFGRSGSWSRR
jgi:FixJ family two-component response regulator